MSIVSYLAYPVDGRREQLLSDLTTHPNCDVVLSENSDIFILVTDTLTRDEEKETERFLREHEGLACLAMVHGQLEDERLEEEVVEEAQEFRENEDHAHSHSEER